MLSGFFLVILLLEIYAAVCIGVNVVADNDRITVIINEITYWKNHKLLPQEQCDFLLALYTKGDRIMETEETDTPKETRNDSNLILQLCLLILLLPFSFLVLYFTEFHSGLQLGILILFLCYAIWSYGYHKQANAWITKLALMITLLLILLLTIFLSNQLVSDQYILYFVIMLNFVGWFLIGNKFKLKFLMVISIFLLIFSILYFTL
jgi:hypothetical protein